MLDGFSFLDEGALGGFRSLARKSPGLESEARLLLRLCNDTSGCPDDGASGEHGDYVCRVLDRRKTLRGLWPRMRGSGDAPECHIIM